MRRAIVVAAAALATLGAWAEPARAVPDVNPGAWLVAMPEDEVRAIVEPDAARSTAVALGVLPGSADPVDFYRELAFTAPEPGSLPSAAQVPRRPIAEVVGADRVHVAVAASMRAHPLATIADGYAARDAWVTLEAAARAGSVPGHVAVLVLRNREDLRLLEDVSGRRAMFLVGGSPDAPPLIAAGGQGFGLLGGGSARRPGIVTPYDVTWTIVNDLHPPDLPCTPADCGGLPQPDVVAGAYLYGVGGPDALARVDALETRLERDLGVLEPVTKATVGLGLGALLFGSLALALRRRGIAAALFRVAATAPAGYVGALFIPDARWEVRAAALAGAAVFGLTFAVRDTRRYAGWMFLLTSAAVTGLTLAAARAPAGEPALSLWANPLESWRFFGLRNHLAAFLATGVIAGAALLAFPWWIVLALTGGAGVVLGAATLGANFLGVLTLGFGGVIAAAALLARRIRWWHVPVAMVVATGSTIVAMAADRSGVSHGGRAFDTLSSGGARAALDLFRGRARLNRASVEQFGVLGWVALALLVLVLGALFVWAWRTAHAHPPARAAVGGAAAAALAALVTEDSGFFTAGIVGVYAWAGWGAERLAWLRARAAPAPAPPPSPPERPVPPSGSTGTA